ncbi:putative reverse transcriptase domain-containing protein [Tanacetum coccineum]
MAQDCRSPTTVNTQRALGAVQKTGTCFKCGSQGHFKRDCPKLKNQNYGNAAGNGEARGRAYALGGGEPNPDSNVVTVPRRVRIPYCYEVLIVQGDKSDGRNKSRLNIISCTKTQKYLLKGCYVFLVRITEKKTEDKSEKK